MHVVVDGLRKTLGWELILDDISFEIPSGSLVAVLGLNGCGKTTLLRCLSTISSPDRGRILLDGEPLNRKRLDLRKRLHFVPDAPMFSDEWDAVEYLSFVLDGYGCTEKGIEDRVEQLLDELQVREVSPLRGAQLSRGQRHKIALATLFALDPDLWLCDEPFASGMDPAGLKTFRKHARSATQNGHTVIYSTQILEIAESFADLVCVIHQRQVKFFGTLEAMREHDQSQSDLNSLFSMLTD